ncbi:MAG: QcrA and Rieske domain-containing protein [Limisphaerales bacterium]
MVNPTDPPGPPNPERRDFMKKACAVCLGTAAVLVPVAAGVTVLLDPLRRKTAAGEMKLITSLDALPADGTPQKFAIMADRVDAWTKFPNAPVGAIYLRRTGEKSVEAINVVCPHAGCFVDFRFSNKDFYCPCHNSAFGLDGKITDPRSPSPRGLDTLQTEIRNDKEVWVLFQNFQTGNAQKIPVA